MARDISARQKESWLVRSLKAMVQIALRRMLKQSALTLLAVLGVIFAVAFCTAIPLYTNTIFNRLLQTELYDKRRSMPAFGLLFRYRGDPEKALNWTDIGPVSDYLEFHTASALGLPKVLSIRFVMSPVFAIYPPDQNNFEKYAALTQLSFGTQSHLESHIVLSETADTPPISGTVDVFISEQLQYNMDWQVGQTLIATMEETSPLGVQQVVKIPVRISGIWRKKDPTEAYWFFNPTGLLDDMFVLTDADYAQEIAPLLADAVANAHWYMILDGDLFRPNQADAFLRRLESVTVRTGNLLPNIELMVAPAAGALREYQAEVRWLTVALFAFSVPVLGVILIFLGMVVRLIVQHQRTEIAILRSRGATEEQTLGIAAIQGAIISAAALAAGLPIGRQFAMLMARARGFLDYSGAADFQLLVTPANVQIGLGIAAGLIFSLLWSTYGLLNTTIVLHHQDAGRSKQSAWWQSAGLDLVLMGIAIYGVIQIRQQDLLPVDTTISGAENIQQDPLLFLVPALCSIAFTLVAMRLLPIVSAVFARVIAQTQQVTSLLAARQVARQPGNYNAPLILLVLTLSLAVFTASLALTLKLYEGTLSYREIGTDLSLVEVGENTDIEIELEIEELCINDPELPCPWENARAAERWIEAMGLRNRPTWRFLPVADHVEVQGVLAASRVGRYSVEPLSREIGAEGIYLGIDRNTFVDVAYWLPQFAESDLGSLMNALAIAPDGVLVSREMVDQLALVIGETLPVRIIVAKTGTVGQFQEATLLLKVVGIVDRFPSWMPDQGPLFVGNLDYLFQEAGGQFPYEVWLKTDSQRDPAAIVKDVKAIGYNVQRWSAPSVQISRALTRPEFQGLMGMLSTGFLIAACLTVLGLLLYIFFSFRRRAIEVGTLRAIGLSKGQVTGLMVWELAFLMLLGSLGGTGIGLGISEWLIPTMRVGRTTVSQASVPVAVHIAWSHVFLIYGLFSVLFLAMIVILTTALNRIKLYAVLKLGDTM